MEQEFEEQDLSYLLQQYRIRPANLILSQPDQYGDPFAWQVALDRARTEEEAETKRLVEEHGYPAASGLDWREAHQKRLQFLMAKYPSADWDLLLKGQFEGRDRKPSRAKVRPVTLQVIEQAQHQFLALMEQREELHAYGDCASVVTELDRTLKRKRETLEGYGISVDVLLQEQREQVAVISLEPNQQQRLSEKVVVLEQRVQDMLPYNSEGESELLAGTRRVLARYRDAIERFDVHPDIGVPAQLATSGDTVDSISPESEASESGDQFLTPMEAAQYLGVHYQTMLSALRLGEVPQTKVGRQYKIPRAEFEEWARGAAVEVGTNKVAPAKPKTSRKKPEPEPRQPPTIRHGRSASF